ncbi:MAG: alpha-ketoglutarate-dependent dioxygenase AlkB family protein [Flavobacteriaceae bacterium]
MQVITSLPGDGTPIDLKGGRLRYFESFFQESEAKEVFNSLLEQTPWKQDPITVFGKTYQQPRLTALYATNTKPYSYSGITMKPLPMTPLLETLRDKIHQVSSNTFTTVLLNLYRDGKDSNGWHADDEKELGKNPVIASLSFGAERYFHLKHRKDKNLRLKIPLKSGSLLMMEEETQTNWLHQIAKTTRPVGPRINLTFRKIT